LPPVRGWLLGVGGDAADPVGIPLGTGRRRLLVAGPPGSGRSSVLQLLLDQSGPAQTWIAAPRDSPLVAAAARHAVPVITPDASPSGALPSAGLLLVDDAEQFTDTPAGDVLLEWVRSHESGGIAVVAARTDALAVGNRGLGAELRRARCGVLLQPGPLDGELLGVRLARPAPSDPPGRGVLVPDPAWQVGREPVEIQIAFVRTDQPMCG
jgi:S-DNA-T family DNA segregation ATPase FtsK/SpoIIIE